MCVLEGGGGSIFQIMPFQTHLPVVIIDITLLLAYFASVLLRMNSQLFTRPWVIPYPLIICHGCEIPSTEWLPWRAISMTGLISECEQSNNLSYLRNTKKVARAYLATPITNLPVSAYILWYTVLWKKTMVRNYVGFHQDIPKQWKGQNTTI